MALRMVLKRKDHRGGWSGDFILKGDIKSSFILNLTCVLVKVFVECMRKYLLSGVY